MCGYRILISCCKRIRRFFQLGGYANIAAEFPGIFEELVEEGHIS